MPSLLESEGRRDATSLVTPVRTVLLGSVHHLTRPGVGVPSLPVKGSQAWTWRDWTFQEVTCSTQMQFDQLHRPHPAFSGSMLWITVPE